MKRNTVIKTITATAIVGVLTLGLFAGISNSTISDDDYGKDPIFAPEAMVGGGDNKGDTYGTSMTPEEKLAEEALDAEKFDPDALCSTIIDPDTGEIYDLSQETADGYVNMYMVVNADGEEVGAIAGDPLIYDPISKVTAAYLKLTGKW